MAKKNTIERKIYRAILLDGVGGGTHLNELMKEYNFSFAKGRPRLSAKVDYQKLLSGDSVSVKKQHLSGIDEETLKKSVEIIQLPKLQHKHTRIDVIKVYLNKEQY